MYTYYFVQKFKPTNISSIKASTNLTKSIISQQKKNIRRKSSENSNYFNNCITLFKHYSIPPSFTSNRRCYSSKKGSFVVIAPHNLMGFFYIGLYTIFTLLKTQVCQCQPLPHQHTICTMLITILCKQLTSIYIFA